MSSVLGGHVCRRCEASVDAVSVLRAAGRAATGGLRRTSSPLPASTCCAALSDAVLCLAATACDRLGRFRYMSWCRKYGSGASRAGHTSVDHRTPASASRVTLLGRMQSSIFAYKFSSRFSHTRTHASSYA